MFSLTSSPDNEDEDASKKESSDEEDDETNESDSDDESDNGKKSGNPKKIVKIVVFALILRFSASSACRSSNFSTPIQVRRETSKKRVKKCHLHILQ